MCDFCGVCLCFFFLICGCANILARMCVCCEDYLSVSFFLFFSLSLSSVQSDIIKSLCLNSVFQLYLIVLLADTECWSPKYSYTG